MVMRRKRDVNTVEEVGEDNWLSPAQLVIGDLFVIEYSRVETDIGNYCIAAWAPAGKYLYVSLLSGDTWSNVSDPSGMAGNPEWKVRKVSSISVSRLNEG